MSEATTDRTSGFTQSWAVVLLAVIASLVTLLVLRTAYPFFEVDKQYEIKGLGASDEVWASYLGQKRLVDTKNIAVLMSVLGGALGVAFAAIRPASVGLVLRLLSGAVVGALVGAVAGSAAFYLQQFFAGQGRISVLQSVMVHSLLFASLGLGLGILSGAFTKNGSIVLQRAGAGLVAGLFAGIAYPILASVLFATVDIDALIPSTLAAQVMWLLLGAVFLGWLIPRTTSEPLAGEI